MEHYSITLDSPLGTLAMADSAAQTTGTLSGEALLRFEGDQVNGG